MQAILFLSRPQKRAEPPDEPLRRRRLQKSLRDEGPGARPEPRAWPCARADVEEAVDRGAVPGLAGERAPEEVLVERQRARVRVAVLEIDVCLLEIGRRRARRAAGSKTRGSGRGELSAPGSGRRSARVETRSTCRPRRRAPLPRPLSPATAIPAAGSRGCPSPAGARESSTASGCPTTTVASAGSKPRSASLTARETPSSPGVR